jgi:glycosyltransferase involved in cell wall biosynthesis
MGRTASTQVIPRSSPLAPEETHTASRRILLVAPSPPPYGGMAIQARLLEKLLGQDGHPVVFFPCNCAFPRWLRLLERVPCVRTAIRTLLFSITVWGPVRKAEVVHVFAASWLYFFAFVCPTVLFGRKQGKRVVLNYRGGDAKQFFRWYGWLVKPIFKLASVVTTPSEFLAEAIRERFGVAVRVVPNILDSSTFRYRQRTGIQPNILVTRHLEKIYGVDVALRAFRSVQSHYPNASLWIAGTGSQEDYLRGLVSSWNLQNVRFLGYVAHRDLGAIYEQRDILLNASFVDNFPGALLEASGAGLAVISTAAGGIPFMFQNAKNALLVEPGDWMGLAEAVERVLRSPALGAALAREATALARGCQWVEVRKSVYAVYGFAQQE